MRGDEHTIACLRSGITACSCHSFPMTARGLVPRSERIRCGLCGHTYFVLPPRTRMDPSCWRCQGSTWTFGELIGPNPSVTQLSHGFDVGDIICKSSEGCGVSAPKTDL